MDGQQQRRALTAAEQALRALAAGDGEDARRSAARAAELDQVSAFESLPVVVGRGADELARGQPVSVVTWDAIRRAVGPGPLQALVEG